MDNQPILKSLRKVYSVGGFVVDFLLCGPFNENGEITSCLALKKDYLAKSGGEKGAKPHAGQIVSGTNLIWQGYAVRYGFTANLRTQFTGDNIIAYAAAYLNSPSSKKAQIKLGSDDGFRLYLNGKLIAERDIHRGLGVDNDIIDVVLKKGVNLILIKIEQNFGAHEFCLRITNRDNKPIKDLMSYTNHPGVKNPIDYSKQRTVSSYDYLLYKTASAKQRISFNAKTKSQVHNWQKKFKSQLTSLLGQFPSKCPLKPEITDECEVANFKYQRLLVDLEPGYSIPCYVTIPLEIKKNKKLPAIVCLHGHGRGKSDMLSFEFGKQQQLNYNDPSAIALHMAGQGYITISPDFLAFGERFGKGNFVGPHQDLCPAEFAWAQLTGIVPTAINIHTVSRCIDYLETLKFVDNRRIATAGHSFGGYMTIYSSAFDKRIKAAVTSGWLHVQTKHAATADTCGSQVIPGLLNIGDISDVGCLIAPRPMLIITGKYDCVTPFPFAVNAYKKIRKAYKLLGAEECVSQHVFEGGHVFMPDVALEWLGQNF